MVSWLDLLLVSLWGMWLKHQLEWLARWGVGAQLELWWSLRQQRWQRVEQAAHGLLAHPGSLRAFRADALRSRALVHGKNGREGLALLDVAAALEVGIEPGRSWFVRGLILYHFGRHPLALSALEQCLLCTPFWQLRLRRTALRFQGLARLAMGQAEALEPLLLSGQSRPEERAAALALAGRYQDALQHLGCRRRLAEVLLRHRHLEPAYFWARRQLELETSRETLLLTGRVCLALDRLEEARQHFAESLLHGAHLDPVCLFWYCLSLGESDQCGKLMEWIASLSQPTIAEGRARAVGPYSAAFAEMARN
jgi:tetratricopeptide (TPR) repeat protein